MSDAVLTTLIKVAPDLLWVLFALIVFLVLRRPLVRQLDRLRTAETMFGSFNFEVALGLVEHVAESRAAGAGGAAPVRDVPSPLERQAVALRLKRAAALLRDGRILWVDDVPANNSTLIALFRRMGMVVSTVESTESGLAELRRSQYDLVITDMHRQKDDLAGFHLLDQLAAEQRDLPVILFTGSFDPWKGVHPRLFGYATAYDDLIHLVIDVMDRVRSGEGAVPTGQQADPGLQRPQS